MTTVIIYGPAASGKTRNAEALRQYFGCSQIVDGWDGKKPLPVDSLALTNLDGRSPAFGPWVQIYHIDQAKRLAGIR